MPVQDKGCCPDMMVGVCYDTDHSNICTGMVLDEAYHHPLIGSNQTHWLS